jgi:hypothetical protein
MSALIALYGDSEIPGQRTFIFFATFLQFTVAAAAPAWKWSQAQQAVVRQALRLNWHPGKPPFYGFGAGDRPLWTARDRDAERIRGVLRDANCQESGEGGEGFVVEGGNGPYPFFVACNIDNPVKAATELTKYEETLAKAGFRVKKDPSTEHVLQVRDIGTDETTGMLWPET